MKFRTEIEILPYDRQLSYDDRLLALGSCFATEIGRRMAESKFRIAVNPSGVLFNPLSIVRTLRRYRDGRPVAKEELQHADGRWFHYDFHGSLAGDTADEALTRIDAAVADFRSKRWSRRSNRFCRTNRAANESCSPSAPSVIWATDWRATP